MKNIKTKIILSAIFLSVVSFSGVANAASASLYVSPASITKTAGNIFDASVGVNASGNKVCAIEGTLVFNNLTCQSITVASDVMAQSSPTCSNPYFLIGIPNCTISDKALLTLSVKAGTAATASINATGVDIIGEGISLGSASIGGSYTINAVIVTPGQETPQQIAQSEQETPQQIAQSEQETQDVETSVQSETAENSLINNGQASLVNAGLNNGYLWMGLIIIILGLGYYFIKKRKKQK